MPAAKSRSPVVLAVLALIPSDTYACGFCADAAITQEFPLIYALPILLGGFAIASRRTCVTHNAARERSGNREHPVPVKPSAMRMTILLLAIVVSIPFAGIVVPMFGICVVWVLAALIETAKVSRPLTRFAKQRFFLAMAMAGSFVLCLVLSIVFRRLPF